MNQYWCRGYYVDTVEPSRRILTNDPQKARHSKTLNTQNRKLCFCQRMETQLFNKPCNLHGGLELLFV